jgi:hypothetical protein
MRAPATLPGLNLDPIKLVKPSPVTRLKRVVKTLSASGRAKKGFRVEREIAEMHARFGVIARRVPLSGAAARRLGPDFGGDLRIWAFGDDVAPLTAEVKARSAGGGFVVLERWMGEHDLLVLKRNHAAPMVVLPWKTWARVIGRTKV